MYQCPGCGGRLVFDIPSQQLMCDHCSTKYDPYAISKEQDAEESQEYDVTVFKCPNCGGEILSTDNTAANFCSFCGASTNSDKQSIKTAKTRIYNTIFQD